MQKLTRQQQVKFPYSGQILHSYLFAKEATCVSFGLFWPWTDWLTFTLLI